MRIAIIGCGPKGLYALERLLDHASTLNAAASVRVDVFEPSPQPGAGPHYDPAQPNYLIMNFGAALVDMWWPSSHTVPKAERMTFLEWSSRAGYPISGDSYPPRAIVGRYLAAGFETMLRHSPESVEVRVHACRVDRLSRRGVRWEVAVAGRSVGIYDEVLVATGHVEGSAYPVSKWLSRERIAPGATVAVRGFALTFIDVALALSEGRGGSFSCPDRASRLRYTAPIDPIGSIIPFSRTGRPMLAKPSRSLARPANDLDRISERGRSQMLAIASEAKLMGNVLPIVAGVANASLAATGGHDHFNAEAWLTAAASGAPMTSTESAYKEIEQSIAVATGRAPPDLSWALGHSWRALYPAIVSRLGGDGLAQNDWAAFLHLSAELERIAFGPPAINAAKLLALVDAGQVDLSHLTSDEPEADVVVDAVLPGPGVPPASGTVAAQLIADGYARLVNGRRGLDVDRAGSCRSPDGRPVPGLAAIGRPTEDSVIGNDTLSRILHPVSDHWARRVVERHRLTVAA